MGCHGRGRIAFRLCRFRAWLDKDAMAGSPEASRQVGLSAARYQYETVKRVGAAGGDWALVGRVMLHIDVSVTGMASHRAVSTV